ncbi:MAG: HEPN domain-containing protein [Prolixibacteraceae bacterium]
MKQEMDRESIEALVRYRLQRARETLPEARTLIENSYYNAAVNRLYYACYYAVIALLAKHQISVQTHAGVKQMLGLHFTVTGMLPSKYSKFYTQLFNDRLTGDYDDFILYDKEALDDLYPKAEEFIGVIAELVAEENLGPG